MYPELNSNMMDLLHRVSVGTVNSRAQLQIAAIPMITKYGKTEVRKSFAEMVRHCSESSQDRVKELLAGKEIVV